MKTLALSRVAIASVMVVTLCGCHPKALRPTPSTIAPVAAVDTTGAIPYHVDGTASELHILVFRGGAMARLGHNHVVSSKELTGRLWLSTDLAHTKLELELPVSTLSVDDPKSRSTEGEEFAVEVPSDAREGTRRNLLRQEVLDAEHFPTILLRSTKIAGNRATPTLSMRITLKGVERDVDVPVKVEEQGKRLTATGEFAIKQSDFGITPFSVALGALQVVDQLKIKFSIVCLKQQ